MSENVAKFHANLVHNHGQKSSLTYTTAPTISWTLHRLYPLLLIFDATLNNLMWCCDDVCLPFINLVLIVLAINLLDPQDTFIYVTIVNSWLGVMSGSFLILSICYYVSTVVRELKQDEPPTLDDIIIVMGNVVYKMEKIRHDFSLFVPLDGRQFLSLIVISSPIHWLVMRFLLSPKQYLKGLLICLLIFHSTWCQSTLRLCWRSLFVRRIWFFLHDFQSRKPLPAGPFYTTIKSHLRVPIPKAFEDLNRHELGLKLQHIMRGDMEFPTIAVCHANVNVVEFEIDENQRKWPLDGWTHHLLSYERQKYSATLDPEHVTAKSPWEFQESLDREWCWIDDCWKHDNWIYADTDWRAKGCSDSLDCYTRKRTWRRRAYRLL